MKISGFKQYFILGILLASFMSFVLTKDSLISLVLLKFLGDVLIIWFCLYIDIYIHEFGHAIAGWIVKFPIAKITIGFGRNLFKYQFKNTTLVINQGMQGGLTNPGSMSPHLLRLRYFFFTLGGVGLQAISIFCVAFVVNVVEYFYPNFLINNQLLDTIINFFFISNIIIIVINLIPMQINLVGIPMPNDGLVLLTIFFMKLEKIQEILLSGEISEGMEYLETKDFAKAESIFKKCSLKYPELLLPKINLSAALIRQNKINESINVLSQILIEIDQDSRKSKDIKRILILNNLAWSYLIKSIQEPEDPNFLRLADEYSQKAIILNNQAAALIGTRACILIEMGEIDAGIKLLKNRVNLHQAVNEITNHPIGFLYLAYAYYLHSNYSKSQKYWQKIKDNPDLKSSEYQVLYHHVLEKTNYFESHNQQ